MIRAALNIILGFAVLVTFTLALDRLDHGLRAGGGWSDASSARLALLSQR